MLRINGSITDLVAAFPFDGHGIELSCAKVVVASSRKRLKSVSTAISLADPRH
jgi:hypothetical protein